MAGASTRWAADELLAGPDTNIAWSLIAVNTIASALLGFITGSRRPTDQRLRDGIGIGFCGGLSTMSTLAVEIAEDFGAGAASMSFGWGALLVVTSLATGSLGYGVAKSVSQQGMSA